MGGDGEEKINWIFDFRKSSGFLDLEFLCTVFNLRFNLEKYIHVFFIRNMLFLPRLKRFLTKGQFEPQKILT